MIRRSSGFKVGLVCLVALIMIYGKNACFLLRARTENNEPPYYNTDAPAEVKGSLSTRKTRSSVVQVPEGPIPHIMYFTFKDNIFETKQPVHFYENAIKTVDAYKQAWKADSSEEEDMQVKFLDDTECIQIIKEAEPRLLHHFLNETKGAFKGDICRAAALYLYGGYYFDVDMEVITPVLLDRNITFSTAKGGFKFFFNSFMASTAGHPVLRRNFDVMLDYYSGKGCLGRTQKVNMGCCTLFDAYNQASDRERGPHLLLEEHNLDSSNNARSSYYPKVKRRRSGRFCNWVVHDPSARVAYFYSRIVGSTHCPAAR